MKNKWRRILSWEEVKWSDLEGWLIKEIMVSSKYVFNIILKVEDFDKNYFKAGVVRWQDTEEKAVEEFKNKAYQPYLSYYYRKDLSYLIPIRKIF